MLKGFNANTYLRYILFSSDGFNEYEKNKYLKISSETSTQDYLKKKIFDYDSDDPLSVFWFRYFVWSIKWVVIQNRYDNNGA